MHLDEAPCPEMIEPDAHYDHPDCQCELCRLDRAAREAAKGGEA